MNTNFFSQITQLNITGNLHLIIAKGVEDNIIVSVFLQNEQCGDQAKELIPPFNVRATAQELDEGFLERIKLPLETASGLMDNMEAFMKQMEVAKRQSAMEKEKTDRDKKEKEDKEKKYKEAFSKAESLEKDGKYREAWSALPKTSDFPEHAEAIRKKKETYERQFAPSLFS
jgi:PRTRC genetic system protein E